MNKTQDRAFDPERLRESLIYDAKVVGIPEGAAETIAIKIIKTVSEWAQKRSAITTDDLNRKVASEAEKFNADLAYVYQNRGKII